MTNQDMEQKLQQAFQKATPQVLDAVLSQCQEQKGTVISMTTQKTTRRPSWMRVASLAACFVLILGLGFGFYGYNSLNQVSSVVGLDVNPSVEIHLNKNETVLAVEARNEDGRKIIGDMDFRGSNLDVAVNALLGSMLRNGYLSDLANSILVSVESKDPAKSAALQAEITARVNEMLNTDTFQGAVLSQTVSEPDALADKAAQYGISRGKAQLIQTITQQNTNYTFEALVGLSINELNLLTVSAGHNLDGVQASGIASDKNYIGAEAAKTAALAHAGVYESDLLAINLDLDMENGELVYDVEFDTAAAEYDYDIHAVSGEVLKADKVYIINSEPAQPTETALIDAEAAKAAALAHAGIAADAITGFRCELDRDDGRTVYDISFHSAGYEYDYEIDASSGNVITWERELEDHAQASSAVTTPSTQLIGEEAAKSAALSHAGVTADAITLYQCELDRDDGRIAYEISFNSGNYEYDYEIDAASGAVIAWEKELEDDIPQTKADNPPATEPKATNPSATEPKATNPSATEPKATNPSASSNLISKADAKNAALRHAGVSSGSIRDYECELDKENGKTVYEVSFESGSYEYDYEIDATSGTVIKWEKEPID